MTRETESTEEENQLNSIFQSVMKKHTSMSSSEVVSCPQFRRMGFDWASFGDRRQLSGQILAGLIASPSQIRLEDRIYPQ
jgi:hypothetical protein